MFKSRLINAAIVKFQSAASSILFAQFEYAVAERRISELVSALDAELKSAPTTQFDAIVDSYIAQVA